MADIVGNRIKVLFKEYASGNYVEDVTPNLIQAVWTFKMHGGIEAFEIVLARDAAGLGGLTCPIVEIWCQDANTSWTMVMAGVAEHLVPLCAGGRIPTLTITGAGYLQQLHNAYLDKSNCSWENTTLDVIVEDILDTYVAANSDISRWTAKTTAGSGTNILSLEFDGTAYDAIVALAEMQGGVEWGVVPQFISGTWYPAKFFFVDTAATVNNHFHAKDMWQPDYNYDLGRIRNSLQLRGDIQDADGDTLDTTDSDATSIAAYGKRVEIIDNPYIDNPTDAATYLAAVLMALKDPGRGLGFAVSGKTVEHRMERNTPMGVSHIWNLFSDANAPAWYCNAVTYVAKRDGTIDMYVNLGDKLGVRQIYQTPQTGGPGYIPSRNWLPVFGRGGFQPINPNWQEIDWGRPVGQGRKQRFYSKEYWKWLDSQEGKK